jgi:hypothetical protein
VADDPRLHNPNPQGRFVANGLPRAHEPLWGVDNWPLVFSLIFVAVAVVLAAVLGWRSWRQRRMDFGLIVFLSVTALCWLDPPANWVTFTVYDTNFLHFPTTWAWVRFAPLIEPVIVIPGYPMYYFTVALVAAWVARRFVMGRSPGNRWVDRHPHATFFLVGSAIAAVWDLATELFMLRADMYHYSQAFGPKIAWGHARFPVVWGFYTWFSIAVVTVLLYRDDRGRSLLHSVAERLPSRGRGDRVSSGRQLIAGTLVLSVAYLVPMAIFGSLRAAGLTRPNYSGAWPYSDTKVYDPYGDLERAGRDGPFYR